LVTESQAPSGEPSPEPEALGSKEVTELLDWKRSVFRLYEQVRAESDPHAAWRRWKATRADLFAHHPQSPVPPSQRIGWDGPLLFDYDPAKRVLGTIADTAPEHYEISTSGEESMVFTRFATVSFDLDHEQLSLELYWLDGYGGGLFLPFRDASSGKETYGAGRYLLDTVKGSDLGMQDGKLVLDFNFAYNPSCAYDPRWVCPLAPPPNWLPHSIVAGERV
jgi:uncharacterized protein (DUF1684 family)